MTKTKLTQKEARRLLLRDQERHRQAGKDSDWLRGYAKGWLRVDSKLREGKR